jgi:hypothetical protein
MKIKFYSTGGTIDKIYFDQKSTYQVGEARVEEIMICPLFHPEPRTPVNR